MFFRVITSLICIVSSFLWLRSWLRQMMALSVQTAKNQVKKTLRNAAKVQVCKYVTLSSVNLT